MIDVDKLQPGDLFVTPNKDGLWERVFEYLRPDDQDRRRILGRAVDDGVIFAVRIDAVVVPGIVGKASSEAPACHSDKRPRTGDQPITADQRRMLFGLGKSKGLGIDALRDMTPKGSISALSRTEAGKLIDRLLDKPNWSALHHGNGTATGKQLGLIAHLRDQIGFSNDDFCRWLQRQFKVSSIEDIDDRDLASRVIGGLLAMQRNRSSGPVSASG